ncbi:YicC/YloC family endoribonuclease [Saccharospirillum sp. HFRX-1]|uniref:YicC/YloC family endoribonuclease n=1 Tax=unclassified Saccharospirillum TaxID=2633430 RepID=UPI00371D4C98
MPLSMTAFARREHSLASGQLSVELRSVNHRYLEASFKLPDSLKPVEMPLREQLKKRVARGKVEVNLRFYPAQGGDSLAVNTERLEALGQALDQVRATILDSAAPNAMDLLQWPGVLAEADTDMDAVFESMKALFAEALDDLIAHREREGKELADLLRQRLDAIEVIVAKVRKNAPALVESFRDNLKAKAAQLSVDLDPERLEQEVVLLAQKADVAEELDRLDTHCQEARHVLNQKGAIGRRLDFLMQEFNREANTLGSKATHTDTTQAAVDLKVLIEQMREQVQNIE